MKKMKQKKENDKQKQAKSHSCLRLILRYNF